MSSAELVNQVRRDACRSVGEQNAWGCGCSAHSANNGNKLRTKDRRDAHRVVPKVALDAITTEKLEFESQCRQLGFVRRQIVLQLHVIAVTTDHHEKPVSATR